MIGALRQDLDRLQLHLERLHRPVVSHLRPGLQESDTSALLHDAGLSAADGLADLYAWHDGTATPPGIGLDDLHLIPGFYMPSLDHAISDYLAFRADPRWPLGWLPIMANGGGDFMAVDCAPKSGGAYHFRIEAVDHPLEFDSVASWVATITAAFEHRIYYVDAHGYLEMDDLQFGELARQLNPGVDWWAS